MKKIIAILLSVVIVFSYGTAFAAEPTTTIKTTDKNANNVTVSYRKLTDKQAIQRISEINHISLKDAEQTLRDFRKSSKTNTSTPSGEATLAAATSTIEEAKVTYDFGLGRTVEAGALCEVADIIGPGKPILSVIQKWTGAVGSGAYTFSQLYINTIINPSYKLNILARGTVETEIDLSVSGSAEIKQQLIGCGFSVSLTVGTKVILRKTASWQGSFTW
jgi:hypothetical protein